MFLGASLRDQVCAILKHYRQVVRAQGGDKSPPADCWSNQLSLETRLERTVALLEEHELGRTC